MPGRRGPCPARRADAEPELPRTGRTIADGAEFLYLAGDRRCCSSSCCRGCRPARMALVAAVFIGIGIVVPWLAFDRASTCCSTRSIRRSRWRRSMSAARRSPSCAPSASAREIRGAFGLYLSPDQVERWRAIPSCCSSAASMREITVMFTDVRGFTRISEQFDPHGLTRFMNRFLTPMTDLIQARTRHDRQVHGRRHHGVLERAARRRRATPRAPARPRSPCRRAWSSSTPNGRPRPRREGRQHIPVNIGIGLNTGQASVGNFGSDAAAAPIPAWATR